MSRASSEGRDGDTCMFLHPALSVSSTPSSLRIIVIAHRQYELFLKASWPFFRNLANICSRIPERDCSLIAAFQRHLPQKLIIPVDTLAHALHGTDVLLFDMPKAHGNMVAGCPRADRAICVSQHADLPQP
jgi:hypothetical protein